MARQDAAEIPDDTNAPTIRVYTTSWVKADGKTYTSTVAARDWKEAQHECDIRGLGEKVDGELTAIIEETPDGYRTTRGTSELEHQ